MKQPENVRENVSKAYAESVSRQGGACCGQEPVPKGVAAKLAGYTGQELEELPPEAVVNSFGCGNPLAFSEVQPGDVVLDLGSGAGIDVLIAAKKVGPTGRAMGVDMTDEMIAKANENFAAAGLNNAEVRKGIIEDLPIEAGSVDWVISNCVINLSPEKHRVFAEIARVLKPGGRMLVSDIVVRNLPDWIRNDERLYSSCVAGAISEEAYLQGLRDAGLIDAEVRDRLVYDADQLGAFVKSELPEVTEHAACCGLAHDGDTLERIVSAMAGNVWSANIFARKPADE